MKRTSVGGESNGSGAFGARADRWVLWLGLAAAAGMLYAGIGFPAQAGMADNGDFERVMRTAGIGYAPELTYEDKYFRHAVHRYAIAPMEFGGYATTHLAFLFAARAVNALAGGGAVFRIEALGATYAVVLLAAFALIYTGLQASRATKSALLALLIWAYTDVAYGAYFHSFYGEPASLLGLLLAIGFGLHASRRSGWALPAYFAAIALLVGAKAQNAPLGLVFAASLWALGRGGPADWRRKTALFAAAALALSVACYAAAPKELKRINLYQTVFYGVLKHSDDAARDLRELGLDPGLAALAGTNYFQKGTAISQTDPELDERFYSRIGHADVGLYYLKHPLRWVERLEYAAAHSTSIRPAYLGSFAKEAGRPPGAVAERRTGWSEWKKTHATGHAAVPLLAVGAYAAALRSRRAAEAIRLRSPEALRVVPWVAALAYMTPLLGDGDADLGKHLFLYNAAFDFMVLFAAAALVGCVAAAPASIRERLRRAAGGTA